MIFNFQFSIFNLLIFISILTISIYAYLIIRYIFGWFANFNNNTFVEEENRNTFVEKEIKPSNKIVASIVVSCRNEEQNIANLLDVLTAQDFNKKYELILIDDYSTDKTLKILYAYAESFNFIKVFSLKVGEGKKKAISFGIEKAAGEFILTTDADCVMTEKWVQTFYAIYKKTDVKLISATVLLEGNSFFEQLQQLEFLSLIASGAGSIGINKGIMCNGANLAFSKELFQNKNAINYSQISGDDVFLLQTVKKDFQHQVLFSPNNDLIVRTKAKKSVKSFINQRIRWASKSSAYTDFDMIFSSWTVFLANLAILGLFFGSLFNPKWLIFAFLFFAFKLIVDFSFLFIVTNYIKKKKLLKFFIPLAVLYPFYILFVAISSQFSGFEWKNRKFN